MWRPKSPPQNHCTIGALPSEGKRRVKAVLPILFFLALTMSVLVYFAAGLQSHEQWATGVCRVVGKLCDDPWIIYAGTAIFLAMALLQIDISRR
jgi:hypothetical protein